MSCAGEKRWKAYSGSMGLAPARGRARVVVRAEAASQRGDRTPAGHAACALASRGCLRARRAWFFGDAERMAVAGVRRGAAVRLQFARIAAAAIESRTADDRGINPKGNRASCAFRGARSTEVARCGANGRDKLSWRTAKRGCSGPGRSGRLDIAEIERLRLNRGRNNGLPSPRPDEVCRPH